MPNYGQNVITNSTGIQDTTGWTVSGAAAVTGGTDAGGYCFRIDSTGSMSQELHFTIKPKTLKVSAKFYSDILDRFTPVGAYIKCTAFYEDKEPDEFYIPCNGGLYEQVSGLVNNQTVAWIILESIIGIDEQKKLQKVKIELICDNLGTYGYFDEVQVLPELPEQPALIAKNGEQIIDEYGINEDFIKPSQNLVRNSSFEILEHKLDSMGRSFIGPKHWEGPEFFFSSDTPKPVDGVYCLQMGWQAQTRATLYIVKQAEADGIAPNAWGGGNGRLSFYHQGGPIYVEVVDKNNNPVRLYEMDGEAGTLGKNIPKNDSGKWLRYSFGINTLNFPPNEKLYVKFTFYAPDNKSFAYIDAVQVEKDFTGARPSFFTPGPVEPIQINTRKVLIPYVVAATNNSFIVPSDGQTVDIIKMTAEAISMGGTVEPFRNVVYVFWTVPFHTYQHKLYEVTIRFDLWVNGNVVQSIYKKYKVKDPIEDTASGGAIINLEPNVAVYNIKLRATFNGSEPGFDGYFRVRANTAYMQATFHRIHSFTMASRKSFL